jgi:hypothetical protein
VSARPYRIAILSCSASKLTTRAPAKDLYTGALFKLARQLAELTADRFVILSARHGVVRSDTELNPYDTSLKDVDRKLWAAQAGNALHRELGSELTAYKGTRGNEVLCLAPAPYIEGLGIYGFREWVKPLKGLGIGQQKQTLKRLIAQASAPNTTAGLVLQLDATFAGAPDAPMELIAVMWARLVAAARQEAA